MDTTPLERLMDTEFAPSERLDKTAITKQAHIIKESPTITSLLDAIPEIVMILNQERQVIFFNRALIDTLGLTDQQLLEGPRPGELLKCENANRSKGGCGTSKYCKQCGAVLSILSSQKGETREEECRINQADTGAAFDLRVKAAPFKHNEKTYSIFSIVDISDQKRREVLQRIFFHDILNTAGGLSGYSELLKMAEKEDDTEEYKEIIFDLTRKIISEINVQKELLAAENGWLEPELDDLNSLEMLHAIISTYEQHKVAENKTLAIYPNAEPISFKNDETLLFRVIGNLVKNALEATEKAGKICVDARMNGEEIVFSVHNQTAMPETVQLQLFKRSFSTKGMGRGLGTYSVKLLTEKYLKGRVAFISNKQEGTTFFITLPLDP